VVSVAALYIDPRGPYPKMPGVDAWDETRDARKYDGPHPVVAHPPCGPWGKLSFCSRESAEIKALAPRAVEQVRAFGGVLEHPLGSRLFDFCGIPHPGELPDGFGGVTIEIQQVHWGHPARKRTLLYLVGVPSGALKPPPYPTREPTHWVSGSRSVNTKRLGRAVPPGMKICSTQQRRRTPVAFAEYLVSLARAAAKERAA
jgi:hypothetical protein